MSDQWRESALTSDVYRSQVIAELPRILSSIDLNPLSPTFGIADRYYWSWKLIDFPNATHQGLVHGMAKMWKCGMWPFRTEPNFVIQRCLAMIGGLRHCQSKNGSVAEAFPNEGSWCVTALATYDALSALEILKDELTAAQVDEALAIIEPMTSFIIRRRETHAVISNHLATGSAALALWGKLSSDNRSIARAREIALGIVGSQSTEGWYPEYGGADPGYQSLTINYLADVIDLIDDDLMLESLRKAVDFCAHFVHRDGSFGGMYGSRNTRFYYPAGFHQLSSQIPLARSVAARMSQSVQDHKVVGLSMIDAPNLGPMFNSFVRAALCPIPVETAPPLPYEAKERKRIWMSQSGLFIDNGPSHQTIISIPKGGVVYHFEDGQPPLQNDGVLARDLEDRIYSSQNGLVDNMVLGESFVEVSTELGPVKSRTATILEFALLRLGALTFLKIHTIREAVKRQLVRMLITRSAHTGIKVVRRIELHPNLNVGDRVNESKKSVQLLHNTTNFSAIHMASQGYWQMQDETRKFETP